jgi:hypothetical protein
MFVARAVLSRAMQLKSLSPALSVFPKGRGRRFSAPALARHLVAVAHRPFHLPFRRGDGRKDGFTRLHGWLSAFEFFDTGDFSLDLFHDVLEFAQIARENMGLEAGEQGRHLDVMEANQGRDIRFVNGDAL